MREAGCTNFKLSLWDGIIQAGMFHFIIVLPNINKLMILADANITIEYFVEGVSVSSESLKTLAKRGKRK